MADLTITEGARLAGVHRTTLRRHIDLGKVRLMQGEDGTMRVTLAEIERVYGPLSPSHARPPDELDGEMEGPDAHSGVPAADPSSGSVRPILGAATEHVERTEECFRREGGSGSPPGPPIAAEAEGGAPPRSRDRPCCEAALHLPASAEPQGANVRKPRQTRVGTPSGRGGQPECRRIA